MNAKLVVSVAFAMAICFAANVLACSCGRIPTVEEEWQSSEAVFLGRVVTVHDQFGPVRKFWFWVKNNLGEPPRLDPQTYCSEFGFEVTFRVERSWKGPGGGDIKLLTGRGGGDCGIRFEEGSEYLVFATGIGQRVCNVGGCTRTERADRAAGDLAALARLRRNSRRPN